MNNENLNRVVMPLFDLGTANLTITAEASFGRKMQSGDIRHNTYLSDKGTAFLNPDVYLVFAYKDPENSAESFGKNIYTSFPQTDALNSALDLIYHNVDNGFAQTNGVLVVRPEYSNPVAVTEIGKNKGYIEFKLAVADVTENGVPQRMAAVQLTLSCAPASSLLTVNEFKSIYHIVKNTNLVEFKMNAASLYLAEQFSHNSNNVQYRPVNNNFRSSNNNGGNYSGGYNNNYSRNTNSNYSSAPYQSNNRYPSQNQGYRAAPAPEMVSPPEEDYTPEMRPVNNYTPRNNGGNSLPPRTGNTLINAANVASVPVDNMSFDDDDSIAALLGDLD